MKKVKSLSDKQIRQIADDIVKEARLYINYENDNEFIIVLRDQVLGCINNGVPDYNINDATQEQVEDLTKRFEDKFKIQFNKGSGLH